MAGGTITPTTIHSVAPVSIADAQQSVLASMPDPESISKQKDSYVQLLDDQLQEGVALFEKQLQHLKDCLRMQADLQKQQCIMKIDQQLMSQETALDQQHHQQVLSLQEQAAQQKAMLEQQAMQLTMEYQQKASQEEMQKKHEKSCRMQQQLSEARTKMQANICKYPPVDVVVTMPPAKEAEPLEFVPAPRQNQAELPASMPVAFPQAATQFRVAQQVLASPTFVYQMSPPTFAMQPLTSVARSNIAPDFAPLDASATGTTQISYTILPAMPTQSSYVPPPAISCESSYSPNVIPTEGSYVPPPVVSPVTFAMQPITYSTTALESARADASSNDTHISYKVLPEKATQSSYVPPPAISRESSYTPTLMPTEDSYMPSPVESARAPSPVEIFYDGSYVSPLSARVALSPRATGQAMQVALDLVKEAKQRREDDSIEVMPTTSYVPEPTATSDEQEEIMNPQPTSYIIR
jgi:hypothetical protein